jgi:CubicO group peptidase (beta-lactamase class C family)
MTLPIPPPSGAASTVNQRERFSAAYSVLERAVEERAFPGAAFGVLLDGQILALDGVGRFTYGSDSPAVAPHTIYDLASVTKVAATTAAAMLLYDRGRLDLERPLGDILAGFVIGSVRDGRSESAPSSPIDRCRVTLRNLLTHSSGLPAYARLFETSRDAAALLNACLHIPLEAPPCTRSEYSDIGFILLGKAIELLSKEALESFCASEVFTPLGMTATRYKPPPSWRERIPPTVDDTTFRYRLIQGEVHDENCSILGGVSGHAGVFSNVPDLLAFAACILAGGKAEGGRQIFQSKTIDLFASRQNRPQGASWALGWDTPSGESSSGHYFSPNSIGHLGYAGTSLWIDRDRALAIVLLTNRTWPDRSSQAIRTVRPAFHDAVRGALTFT